MEKATFINKRVAGRSFRKPETAITVLIIFYLVGIIGISIPLHKDFVLLTPFNLLLSLVLVFWHHPLWDRNTIFFIILCYIAGLGAEIFGVQTGLLFGNYVYGPVLGPKLMETPWMIGVNWVLLVYCTGVTAGVLLGKRNWFLRALAGSVLMVGLDFLIEPVAMRFDFWQWPEGSPPLRNYIGWFLVSFPLQIAFIFLIGETKNKVAVALLILQFLFFLILGWI